MLLTALRFPTTERRFWFPNRVETFDLGLIISGNGKWGAAPDFSEEFWAVANTGIVIAYQQLDTTSLSITIQGELLHQQRWVGEPCFEYDEDTGEHVINAYRPADLQRWRGRCQEENSMLIPFWRWYDALPANVRSDTQCIEDAVAKFREKRSAAIAP